MSMYLDQDPSSVISGLGGVIPDRGTNLPISLIRNESGEPANKH